MVRAVKASDRSPNEATPRIGRIARRIRNLHEGGADRMR
jgi:hypothetical protein